MNNQTTPISGVQTVEPISPKTNGHDRTDECSLCHRNKLAGACMCTLSADAVSIEAAHTRAMVEARHNDPEWQEQQRKLKQSQADLRAIELEEADYVVIGCKECGRNERLHIEANASLIAAQLCLGCYREAFTKAAKEKKIRCKGECGEKFPKSLLDEEGFCGACRSVEEPEPDDPASTVLYQAINGPETKVISLMSHKASTVKPVPLRWIWEQRFPAGKLALLNGPQGEGKSMLFIDIIGHVSTGKDWPDGAKNALGPRRVLLASTEDDEQDTIIPRLMAAGADMDNVEILDKVNVEAITKNAGGNVMTRGKSGKTMLDLKLHTKLLKGLIKKYPDVALILLDPITAFLGVDETKDKDTRPVLESVAEAMHGTLTTLIGIIHSNKMTKGSAGDKVKGGSSMLGVTRTAWAIGCDPDDRDQKYMALIKGNVLRKKTGLRFRIENKVLDQEAGLEAGYIVWGDEMLEDANDMLAATRDTNREDGKTRKVDTAKDLILRMLAKAPMRSTDIYDRGKEMNISSDTVKEAARQLMKEIGLLRKQRNDGWWMGLAEHKDILWGIGPPVVEGEQVEDVEQL